MRQVVGYDRLVGEHAYRQLTELYRGLRLSAPLRVFPVEDCTAGKLPVKGSIPDPTAGLET